MASENLQNIHDASRYTLTLWRHRDHSRKPSDVILKVLISVRVRIQVGFRSWVRVSHLEGPVPGEVLLSGIYLPDGRVALRRLDDRVPA